MTVRSDIDLTLKFCCVGQAAAEILRRGLCKLTLLGDEYALLSISDIEEIWNVTFDPGLFQA